MVYNDELKIKTSERLCDLRKNKKDDKNKSYSLLKLKKELYNKTGVNISHTTLGNYEQTDINHEKYNDSKSMSITNLMALSHFYNVSTDYLLGITDITSNVIDIKSINKITGLSEKAIEILKFINKKVETGLNRFYDIRILNRIIENIYFPEWLLNLSEYEKRIIFDRCIDEAKDMNEINNFNIDEAKDMNDIRKIMAKKKYINKPIHEALFINDSLPFHLFNLQRVFFKIIDEIVNNKKEDKEIFDKLLIRDKEYEKFLKEGFY